jgi:hypothetical protein
MNNLYIGHHIIHVSRSFLELGLVEVVWAVTAISVAVLMHEWFFA